MKTSQIEEYLENNEFNAELIAENICPDLREYLDKAMKKTNITRAELIQKLNLDRNYGYQLLNGTRKPSRKHLIQIGLLLRFNIDEMQRLLKIGEKKSLYVRDLFDARVFYAFKHKMSFEEAREFIWEE